MSKPNPTFYAVLTADVRYNNTLTSTAKLLFAEITALTQSDGACWASNNYFAKLYGISPKHVSELISSLVGEGHVVIEIDKAGGNKRYIRLAQAIRLIPDTYPEKSGEGYPEKSGDNNNTSNNTKARTSSAAQSPDLLKAYRLYLKYFIISKDTSIEGVEGAAEKRYRLTPKRVAAIERRLKDAKPKLLFAAIVGYGRADWSNGKNDRRWTADLADFICKNYENVERGARLYDDQRKNSLGDDAWANL